MLRNCLSVGSFVALASVIAVWAGCSSDDAATARPDAGAPGADNDAATNTPPEQDAGNGGANTGLDGGVMITYGTCATFAACGGNVVGDWKVTGGCLSADTFAAAKAQCPGLKESNVAIQAAGTVDFTATQVTRDTTIKLTGSVYVPTDDTCTADTKDKMCTTIGFGLTLGVVPGLAFDKATCVDGSVGTAKGCNCTVEKTITDTTTKPYTTANNVLTTTNPDKSTQTYDYCVNGSTNTYRETTQSQALQLYVMIGKQ